MKMYSVDDFKKLFELAEDSSFLKGQNARNWSASFDWMMKDTNFAKILDGNYQDKGSRMAAGDQDGKTDAEPYSDWKPDYHIDYEVPPEGDIFGKP